jgi:hypothetical protein
MGRVVLGLSILVFEDDDLHTAEPTGEIISTSLGGAFPQPGGP